MGSDVIGEAHISLTSTPLEHLGVEVELYGRVEVDGTANPPFLTQSVLVAGPGVLSTDPTYKFSFKKPTFRYDSLSGERICIKYCVKLTLMKSFTSNLVVEHPIAFQRISPVPGVLTRMKTELGFEDLLQVELSLDKLKYCTSDMISGLVYFIQVRLLLKSMFVCFVRKERVQGRTFSFELARQELMDGPAQRGDEVPIRLYLAPLLLTPTLLKVEDDLAVKYAIKLEFVDEEGNTFEKSQELTIWRRSLGGTASNPFVS